MIPLPRVASAAAACLLGLTITAPASENDVLLKILVRKGILTESEAAAVKAEVAREKAKTAQAAPKPAPAPAAEQGLLNKLVLRESVETLKLYGDFRMRYQYEDKDLQAFTPRDNRDDGSPSGSQQSRWRFRLRLGADVKLADHWSAGVELSTAQASDSGNQTYENGFDDYNIYISKAFLKWDPSRALSVTAGKMTNPFYATDLVWDPDITPTGVAEVVRFHELIAPEAAEESAFSKDGKSVVANHSTPSRNWELSLVAGQFIFDDNFENNLDNDAATDAYTFQAQLLGKYHFANGMKLTAAPGWFINTSGAVTGLQNSNPFNDSPNVSGATRNINLLLFPGDLAFKIGGVKTKFYWDFSYNIEGRKRTEDIFHLVSKRNDVGQASDDGVADPDDFDKHHSPQDDFAYLVGLKIGENKKKGDFSFAADWRQTGIAAVDPNLNDSNFMLGELNSRGLKLQARYNFTDFAFGTVTYFHGWNLRNNLIGGEATGGNAIGDANTVRVLQADVSVEF